MKVLSLFDGISCGRLALERADFSVEKYDAFEIDKYAISVSKNNFPDIIQHGDVFNGDFTQFKGYDLLLGGSPCTYWSVAKKDREITPDGEGFRLFLQYVRALEESNCKYFVYENNYSIHQNIKDEITKKLGVKPIMINSALVSAQQRKRCYWTNIPNITQPDDKNILLKDVLESGLSWQNKSYCMTSCYHPTFQDNLQKHRNTLIAEPIAINSLNGKSRTLKAQYGKTALANAVNSNHFPATMIAERIVKPIRIGEYGKGGQGQRIYSVQGKSVTLSANGGGQGAKTGLYKIDLPDGDYIIRKLTPVEAERLQTLPDNYTAGISNTQRYKCIGNAWTVDVISHILGGIKDVE
ncbi:MAG: DNA cytosine methyltransferase [Ruminococcus flavefaciens]|nr:DNA cytosine methyltransferase [Ruminococcus flavefaciens]